MADKFTFYPEGVCSMMIEIELDGDTIKDVVFTGGCNGNLSGISRLIKGMKVLLPYLFTKQFASVGYEIFWKMIHNSKLMGLELKEEFVFRG